MISEEEPEASINNKQDFRLSVSKMYAETNALPLLAYTCSTALLSIVVIALMITALSIEWFAQGGDESQWRWTFGSAGILTLTRNPDINDLNDLINDWEN
jgi:hypothetical protein